MRHAGCGGCPFCVLRFARVDVLWCAFLVIVSSQLHRQVRWGTLGPQRPKGIKTNTFFHTEEHNSRCRSLHTTCTCPFNPMTRTGNSFQHEYVWARPEVRESGHLGLHMMSCVPY